MKITISKFRARTCPLKFRAGTCTDKPGKSKKQVQNYHGRQKVSIKYSIVKLLMSLKLHSSLTYTRRMKHKMLG